MHSSLLKYISNSYILPDKFKFSQHSASQNVTEYYIIEFGSVPDRITSSVVRLSRNYDLKMAPKLLSSDERINILLRQKAYLRGRRQWYTFLTAKFNGIVNRKKIREKCVKLCSKGKKYSQKNADAAHRKT